MGIKDALTRLLARTKKVKAEVTKKTAEAKAAKKVATAAETRAKAALEACKKKALSDVSAVCLHKSTSVLCCAMPR